MRDLILQGNRGQYKSRSEADMAVCVAMFGAGFEEAEVWAVMMNPSNGISEKYHERERGGERYLALTIGKAAALAQASPRRHSKSKARRVRKSTL